MISKRQSCTELTDRQKLAEIRPEPILVQFDQSGKLNRRPEESESENEEEDKIERAVKQKKPKLSILKCLANQPVFRRLVHSPVLPKTRN